MPLHSDLGLCGAALVVLLFAPVLALVVRRRWRLAAERQEEVRRLALLAAAEAERVEREAMEAYAAASAAAAAATVVAKEPSPRPECPVCFSPATARCGQCKAVRYCSGKCQIVHWRQGHKDECHPPSDNDNCSGEINVSGLKVVQVERPGLSEKSLDHKEELTIKAAKIFSERPAASESASSPNDFSEDDKHEGSTPVDVSVKESTSSPFAASSVPSLSTFSNSIGTPHDALASGEPLPPHDARLGKSSSSDNPTITLRTAVDSSHANPTSFSTPELAGSSPLASTTSCSSDIKETASTSETEVDESMLSGSSVLKATASLDYTSTKHSEITGEGQVSSPQRVGDGIFVGMDSRTENSSGPSASPEAKSQSEHKETLTSNTETSGSVSNGMSTEVRLLKSKSLRSLAFASDQVSSDSGAHPVAFCKSSKVGNVPGEPNRSPDISGAIANGLSMPAKSSTSGSVSNGMSVEVQSLNSKTLRSLSFASDQLPSNGGAHPVAFYESSKVGNAPGGPIISPDSSGAIANGLSMSAKRVVKQLSSHKISRHSPSELILFPYDLFIKLYNSDKIALRPCGLINCGNSCYANAVLQCLSFTRPLTAYLLEGLHSKRCPKKEWCFTCEFESLVMKTKQGKSPLSPIGILSHLHNIGTNFGHGQEEDAHEFLRYAIDAMQSDCLKEAGAKPDGLLAEETTLIQQTFGGYLRSKIRCSRCKGKSERCERMMDLTVEIHGDIATLDEALSRFTSAEILDGENKYECDRCKSYERARKRLTILEVPNVLTIVLKRFQSGKFGKLNKAVRFPEYLNLARYMSGDDTSPVYQLYAVVVHIDVLNASFSGHYVCYVKDTQGKWYKINDSEVTPVELEKVLSKGAYMLLYARCSPRAPSSVRKAMVHDLVQARKIRSKEPKGKTGDSSIAEQSKHFYPHQIIADRANFQSSDLFSERLRPPSNDSSSDSSSLFDEGSSCSTDSTRDSTSTEESWERMSGESDCINLSSPLRVSEDSDGLTHSPLGSRHTPKAALNGRMPDLPRRDHSGSHASTSGREIDQVEVERLRPTKHHGGQMECAEGTGSPSFLYCDRSEHSRNLTERCRTAETDWISPNEVKSGVLLRRSTRERTAQTFY